MIVGFHPISRVKLLFGAAFFFCIVNKKKIVILAMGFVAP
ncbi:hypothetical protein [Lactococcus sp.]